MCDAKLEPRFCGYKYRPSLSDPRFSSSHKHNIRPRTSPPYLFLLIRSNKSASNTMPKHTRNESGDEKQAAKKAKPAKLVKDSIKRPPKDHQIFGERGIMRGILWYPTETGSSTKLNPEYQVKDARVRGHNDIEVGAWWPRQLAAKRDGAHCLYLTSLFMI
jgi:hypothetical protein